MQSSASFSTTLTPQQLRRCLSTAVVIWGALLYFAGNIHYIGDDFTLLGALFGGGIVQSLHTDIRPLEYLIAWLSLQSGHSLWLIFSLAAYCGLALVTLMLANLVSGDRSAPAWKMLVCAASPLAANAYFQIDAVSQALSNLFGAWFALAVMLNVCRGDAARASRDCWRLVPLAILSLLSKETSYGIVFAGCAVLLFKHRRAAVAPVACVLLLQAALMWWSLLFTMDISSGSHYGFKKNPLYWVFGLVFSIAVALASVPTSLLLTGTFTQNLIVLCLTLVGVASTLATAIALWSVCRDWFVQHRSAIAAEVLDPRMLMLLFSVFAIVPAAFFKISELYASQMLPFLKALLIAAFCAQTRAWPRRTLTAVTVAWVGASAINLLFYAVSSGYEPESDRRLAGAQKSVYLAIADASAHQRRIYSIYSMNRSFYNKREGNCEISSLYPRICLPRNIISDFPSRR